MSCIMSDDFFYINTRPNEGGIFVQCGKPKVIHEFEMKKDDVYTNREYFFVKGLADSFDGLMR
jgi:hypothetical protein